MQTQPRHFCWTRFGTEAGEPIEAILARKEAERRAGAGVFYWGIGNSVGPGIAELVRRQPRPAVLFSPMRGKPRPQDAAPSRIVRWLAGETSDGEQFDLPSTAYVTSRSSGDGSRKSHYALVCASPVPLSLSDLGSLRFGALRNLRSGRPVGASQVTAVVERFENGDIAGAEYRVALRATLVFPHFVRLRDPVVVDHEALARPPSAA